MPPTAQPFLPATWKITIGLILNRKKTCDTLPFMQSKGVILYHPHQHALYYFQKLSCQYMLNFPTVLHRLSCCSHCKLIILTKTLAPMTDKKAGRFMTVKRLIHSKAETNSTCWNSSPTHKVISAYQRRRRTPSDVFKALMVGPAVLTLDLH